MNKLAKEKVQQIVLVWIMTAVVGALLWYFGIASLNGKRSATAGEIQAVEDKIADGNKKKGRATASKQSLETVEKELKQKEAGMASGELFFWLDSKLNEFIQQNNLVEVDISNKSRGEAADVGILPLFPYKAVKYALRGTAYYHDFGRFVAAFENAFPYMRLQNVELVPGGQFDSSDPERLSFRMEIVALLKPVEEAAGAAPAAKK
jgi:cell division protein FtsL